MSFSDVDSCLNLLKCNVAVESCTLFLPLHLQSPSSLSFSLPPRRLAPGCSPLCDGSSNSGKRSAGIPGRHTGPSGARNMRSGAYKATGRGAHLLEIIRCLCLPGLWQVDRLCLWRRPSESHYEPLSGLSDTQTHIATVAADISAKWIEPFASLLNVRKYQSLSTVFCQSGHLARRSLSFSLAVALLPSHCVLFLVSICK